MISVHEVSSANAKDWTEIGFPNSLRNQISPGATSAAGKEVIKKIHTFRTAASNTNHSPKEKKAASRKRLCWFVDPSRVPIKLALQRIKKTIDNNTHTYMSGFILINFINIQFILKSIAMHKALNLAIFI